MGTNENVIAYSMHGAMIGRKDTAGPMGSGFFEANKPSYTLTASSQARHGVVVVFQLSGDRSNPNVSVSEIAYTLPANPMSDRGQSVNIGSQVRRLTPLECERLQGFPDNWTADQVDTHRYKQMGNAVAVPVVEWIIQGITDSI